MIIRVLAVNTVTDICSVAIMIDQQIYHRYMLANRLHAENILYVIDQLLIDTGVQLQSLDFIVFDQGPGSFMGIRLGLSVAQGLALGADLPLIAVSSLEVLAQGAWRIFSAKHVITVINICAHKLYWAHFSRIVDENKSGHWICIKDACIVTTTMIKHIIDSLEGQWSFIGPGWNINAQLISYIKHNTHTIISSTIMSPNAQDMLLLGVWYYKQKKIFDINQIKLFYLSTL